MNISISSNSKFDIYILNFVILATQSIFVIGALYGIREFFVYGHKYISNILGIVLNMAWFFFVLYLFFMVGYFGVSA